jgi:FAD/FMN-containing dehydrogenase
MSQVNSKPADAKSSTIDPEAIGKLRGQIRGSVILPDDANYHTVRSIWNGMIDRKPALIIVATGAADVILAVNFAREHNTLLAIRGGGHNIAGNAVCDGGVMLDLSAMKSVRVDPHARTARVEPGVTLGEFDREAQAFGLTTPTGINSTTGIAGLTLGGGFGWLSRKYGITADNLISADVVTADGKLLHASAHENADLFWALRGGGGNFGVVTSFEFRLHPVGPMVLAGLIVHPLANAKSVLQGFREIMAKAPAELACWFVSRKAPPLPFLSPEVHGTEVLVLAMCYCGDLDAGQAAVAPLRALGSPLADVVGPMPYAGWQTAFDPLLAPGARNYWKSHSFTTLSDEAIDVFVDYLGRLPGAECEVFCAHLGGAINQVPATATAYPHRDVNFILNVHTRWRDVAEDEKCIAWARGLFKDMEPHATGGVYVNFMPEDEEKRVSQGAYGANYARLAALKHKYDPTNLFRLNQNILPEG